MNGLLERQSAVFAAADPLLPTPVGLPAGEDVAATLADGTVVGARIYRAVHGPDAVESLWEPRTVWEVTPVLGDSGAAGMTAVLDAVRARIAAGGGPDPDSGVRVYWPSREVTVAPALLAHGFLPLTVLAVRCTAPSPTPPDSSVTIRRATLADLPDLVAIQTEELRYSAAVIGSVARDNAANLLETALRRAVHFGGRVLIAERDGVPVGAVDCGLVSPDSGTAIEHRLPPGRWGYLGTVSVIPGARGTGVGSALVTAAHEILDADDPRGVFLFYEPSNPLSSVFWPRHGYRPLWTKWLCRPVTTPAL